MLVFPLFKWMNSLYVRILSFITRTIFSTGQRGKCLINHRKAAWWFGTKREKYCVYFKETENWKKQRIVITPREIWPGSADSTCWKTHLLLWHFAGSRLSAPTSGRSKNKMERATKQWPEMSLGLHIILALGNAFIFHVCCHCCFAVLKSQWWLVNIHAEIQTSLTGFKYFGSQ